MIYIIAFPVPSMACFSKWFIYDLSSLTVYIIFRLKGNIVYIAHFKVTNLNLII